jgi:hypothetical protein
MEKKNGLARNLLIWSYERGTLPYDIICGLILAFIFFVPRSCFAPRRSQNPQSTPTQTLSKNPGELPQKNGDHRN